ncbi:MAG: MarR family transcriptional regulator [Bacteroidota bacterium]|nr:MarR family transcriptional regulator [Bacteroidota bacterium]
MVSSSEFFLKEPIGRRLDKIAKLFLGNLQSSLTHLDIERSFYPLYLIDAGNGLTQQELAGKLNCDKVQVVRIIDYLSLNGYVERVTNKVDRRKYELAITEKARLIMPDIQKAFQQATSAALAGLSENQINEFYAVLETIETNLITHKSQSAK